MKLVKKKSNIKLVFKIVSLSILMYFVYNIFSQQVFINKKNAEVVSLSNKLTNIRQKREDLQKTINEENSESDKKYIEEYSRQRLQFSKPNEKIFIVGK